MKRWILSGVVIAGGVIVIACAERRQDAPSGPAASVTALTTLSVCDLSGTSPLVAQYFNADDARAVRGLIDQISVADSGSVAARSLGFDIIAIIARNADSGTGGDATAGSDLINKITPCMFGLAELPETYPASEDYTVAITTAAPGGFGVRGGSTDPIGPVLSRGGSFSGVAPQEDTTWAATLDGNEAPARVVFYGRPGSTGQTYDWKVLPQNARFSPPVLVGVCVDLTTGLMHEEHVGLLPFTLAYFLDPELCASSVSSRSIVSSFTQQLAQLLLPRPLVAAGTTRGVGGSAGGLGSEFGVQNVPTVLLESTRPPTTVTVCQSFDVVVSATDPLTDDPVPGTQVSIVAVNNNGEQKSFLGGEPRPTESDGIATFSNLRFGPGSTGGYRLVVSGEIVDRDAIHIGPLTFKINVKPSKQLAGCS